MTQKYIIGWEEWLALPKLKLPAIKAKVDTGAQISTLHAFDIKEVMRNGELYVRFKTHPFLNNFKVEREACILVADRRSITSSNGEKEKRYIIRTPLIIGTQKLEIDISLTNRNLMRFPMLLGREAIRQCAIVDPSRSCCLGKKTSSEIKKLYKEE